MSQGSKSHGMRVGGPQGEGKGMPSGEWVSRADTWTMTSCILGNRADTGLTVH